MINQNAVIKTDSAHVLISQNCVNDCLFCATADKRRSRRFPTKDQILGFIRKSYSDGISHMIFSGLGEPTLDPNFVNYLKEASALGFKSIRLFTNGFDLTKERAREWKKLGLTDVLLSIHGLENGHDKNVGRKGAFKEVISALKIYSDENYVISVNTCLTKHNISEIPQLLEYLLPFPIKIHTLALPELAGNAVRHIDELIDYEQAAEIAGYLRQGNFDRIHFDNIPYCFVQNKTIEMKGIAPVYYLDGKGENILGPDERRLFHELCHKNNCAYLHRCSGFEKIYIEKKGWDRIPHKINAFMNNSKALPISASRLRENNSYKEKNSSTDEFSAAHHKFKNGLTVVMRPTDKCNLECVYCSSYKASGSRQMDLRMVKTVYESIFDHAGKAGIKNVAFLWHGGEPLMMGKKFYRKAWTAASQYAEFNVKHLIQTNLAKLDSEWLKLFNEYSVDLGTSVDPISDIRIDKGGKDHYGKWFEKFMMVLESGKAIGIVFTVTSKHLKKVESIYNFFKNIQTFSQQSVGIKINPLYLAGRAAIDGGKEYGINPQEYGEFLCDLWNCQERDSRPFPLSPFREWLEPDKLSCEFSGRCHENFLSIDGSGDIYNCARFADSGISFGNIDKTDIEAIFKNISRRKLAKRGDDLLKGECNGCEYWALCHGGCPYFAELYRGDSSLASPFCEAYKIFFKNNPVFKQSSPKAVS